MTATLARRYADALDDCFDELINGEAAEDGAEHARKVLEITRLGGRLEATLDRLGMSPGARPAVPAMGEGSEDDPARAALTAARSESTAGYGTVGIDHSTSVDPSVSATLAAD